LILAGLPHHHQCEQDIDDSENNADGSVVGRLTMFGRLAIRGMNVQKKTNSLLKEINLGKV
jgi:hypothetical protein